MFLNKDHIKTFYALLRHPVFLLRDNTRVFHSKISCPSGNTIKSDRAWITRSSISIQGKDNHLNLDHATFFNSDIIVRGNGHIIDIDPGTVFFNVRIKVIGNNNRIHIGTCSSFGGGNIIHGGQSVRLDIGKHCVFAEGVDIWTTDTHSIYSDADTSEPLNKPASITIGNHVWTAKDVAILKGVTIGDDAVIGFRSLVTKDVPPRTLSVGSPSRVIRDSVKWDISNP